MASSALSTVHPSEPYGTNENRSDVGNASFAEEGNIDVLKSLLEREVDANSRNESNQTPLERAAEKGNVDAARLLIARGSVLDSRNKWGWTLLHFASRFGQVQVSQVLVDHGADVNAKELEHWTPIHLSAANGLLGIAKLLLNRGADVHPKNGDGQTGQAPYQISVASGSRDIAELLQVCVARAD